MYRFLEDGTLDLYQVSAPIGSEEIDIDYKEKLDSLISSDEFKRNILQYDKALQTLFNRLKFTNFEESFYDLLKELNEIQRNKYLEIIKNKIITSDASVSFKEQASLLDNFITPQKC